MRKFLLIFFLTGITAASFGQWQWQIDFDSSWYLDRIVRDTVSNPNCSWQIGQPTKTIFNSAYSAPNVLVTDTSNPVAANDTSVFYLMHERTPNAPWHLFALRFRYQMDGDSTDYGKIEISPDTGNTWIDVLTEDVTYQVYWYPQKPMLKGSTDDWQYVEINMMMWASGLGTFPVEMTADTILFRFTYITDSSTVAHDGWMIDDFFIDDLWEGIPEYQNKDLVSIFPNPASDELIIHRTESNETGRVEILSPTGQVLYSNTEFNGETLDTRHFANGMYLLKYSNSKSFSIKKLVVQH